MVAPAFDELAAYYTGTGPQTVKIPSADVPAPMGPPAPIGPPAQMAPPLAPPGGPVISPQAAAYFAPPISGSPAQTAQAVQAAPPPPPAPPEAYYGPPAPPKSPAPAMPQAVPRPAPEPAAHVMPPTEIVGAAPPRVGGGGGPSKMAGLQKEFLGTYDAEREAVDRAANASIARDLLHAEGRAALAERQQQDLAISQEAETQARERDQQDMAELQQQIEDVRSRKVDPTRLMKDDGFAVTSIIASIAGGLFQGLTGGRENQGVEMVNRLVDRDIQLQKDDIDKDERTLMRRANLVAQNRQIFRDHQMADAQTKNLYYESIRAGLEAELAKNGSPIARANADQALAVLDRAQDQVKMQIEEARQRMLAAGAAAARAELERRRKADLEERKMRVEEGELAVKADKAGEDGGLATRFVATGKAPDGSATGYLARSKEEAGKKETARVGAKSLIALIDEAKRIRKEAGPVERFVNRGGMGVYSPKWMTELKQLEQEMITSWGHAKGLGALSDADRQQAAEAIGGLTAIGSSTDEKLDQARRSLEIGLRVEEEEAAGQSARKRVDPRTGREQIVRGTGLAAAPDAKKTVKREPLR